MQLEATDALELVTESVKERHHPRRSKGDNAKSRNRGTKQPRLLKPARNHPAGLDWK